MDEHNNIFVVAVFFSFFPFFSAGAVVCINILNTSDETESVIIMTAKRNSCVCVCGGGGGGVMVLYHFTINVLKYMNGTLPGSRLMLYLYWRVFSEQLGGLHLKDTYAVIITPQNQHRETVPAYTEDNI